MKEEEGSYRDIISDCLKDPEESIAIESIDPIKAQSTSFVFRAQQLHHAFLGIKRIGMLMLSLSAVLLVLLFVLMPTSHKLSFEQAQTELNSKFPEDRELHQILTTMLSEPAGFSGSNDTAFLAALQKLNRSLQQEFVQEAFPAQQFLFMHDRFIFLLPTNGDR